MIYRVFSFVLLVSVPASYAWGAVNEITQILACNVP
jgi:hypothetical protein